MEDKLPAAGQHQVLSDLNAKASKSTQEHGCLRLLRDSLDSHGADVPAPPVLDLLVINVDLFRIFALFSFFLPFDVDLRNFFFII